MDGLKVITQPSVHPNYQLLTSEYLSFSELLVLNTSRFWGAPAARFTGPECLFVAVSRASCVLYGCSGLEIIIVHFRVMSSVVHPSPSHEQHKRIRPEPTPSDLQA